MVKDAVRRTPQVLGRALQYAVERAKGIRHKDELASTTFHELRTPLTTIREFTSILTDHIAGPLTSAQTEYLGIIAGNVQRLMRLIDSLLDMATLEAGRLLLRPAPLEIGTLVHAAVQTVRPLAEHKQLTLTIAVEEHLELLADADKITQVLLNLLSNAIKCTERGGTVTVRVESRAHHLTMSVMDTGIGIAAGDLPKLFQQFQQVQHTPHGTTKGTGLGLAISKRLVELHGGEMRVTSTPGHGSTFSFTLPSPPTDEVFLSYCHTMLEQAIHRGSGCAFIVTAIPDLAEWTARHGESQMQQVLRQVGDACRSVLRRKHGTDVVVRNRHGLIVTILGDANQQATQAILRRLHEHLATWSCTMGPKTIAVPVVMATATYPDDGATAEALLQCATHKLPRPQGCIVEIGPSGH